MPNRLACETSPYLLQHANNPVNWFPWGAEAHELSVAEDKPILLSIGYSACHWCHVMERESFEDDKIANILNENFVSIKVDREERPDLDQIYMNGLMAVRGGGGGWPLNVFLTPEHELFYGGTYWPPRTRIGSPGFDEVLLSVLDAFQLRRDQVQEQAAAITSALSQQVKFAGELPTELIADACAAIVREFDFENGGFGTAPKFPQCMTLEFLVRAAQSPELLSSNDLSRESLQGLVRLNLKKMSYGGIFDHLGGGFARYSVDESWLVPHFEKMLYDNALLSGVYLSMFQATGDPYYKMIAQKTLDYLARDMRHDEGGLFSTEDADSEGIEGKFYVWDKSEVVGLLAGESSDLFCDLYNVTESGNFEGQNILNMQQSYDEFAAAKSITKQDLRSAMRRCREILFEAREQRVKPGKDDKIIVSWNGLALSSFSRMAIASGDEKYAKVAIGIAKFIQTHLQGPDGTLLHTFRNGTSKLNGYLDDYAYLANGLIDLYEATWNPKWLKCSKQLAEIMVGRFADAKAGGFFYTSNDHEKLITRTKTYQDSSIPSPNAIAATVLWRLGRMLGRTDFLELANDTLHAGAMLMRRAPMAAGSLLSLQVRTLTPAWELVLLCEPSNSKLIELAHKCLATTATMVVVHPNTEQQESFMEELLRGKSMIDGEPALFVCRDFECLNPIRGSQQIEKRIMAFLNGAAGFEELEKD